MDIVVDLWGKYACFCPPYAKVDRMSYPVPTPSAIRGILDSIYCKPLEFFWQVRKIEIMKPVRYETCRRNEVNKVMSCRTRKIDTIDISDSANRAMRTTSFLFDVRYRVTARIMPRPGWEHCRTSLEDQATRRIRKGQCFRQPYFGIREFTCHFAPADMSAEPVHMDAAYGLMPYDMFAPWTGPGSPFQLSLFDCVVKDGVIDVPDAGSGSVIKMPAMNGGGKP